MRLSQLSLLMFVIGFVSATGFSAGQFYQKQDDHKTAIADGCGQYNSQTGFYERVNLSGLLLSDKGIQPDVASLPPMPTKRPHGGKK